MSDVDQRIFMRCVWIFIEIGIYLALVISNVVIPTYLLNPKILHYQQWPYWITIIIFREEAETCSKCCFINKQEGYEKHELVRHMRVWKCQRLQCLIGYHLQVKGLQICCFFINIIYRKKPMENTIPRGTSERGTATLPHQRVWQWTNSVDNQGQEPRSKPTSHIIWQGKHTLMCSPIFLYSKSAAQKWRPCHIQYRKKWLQRSLMVTELFHKVQWHSEKKYISGALLVKGADLTPFFRGDTELLCWRWTVCPNKLLHHKAVIK